MKLGFDMDSLWCLGHTDGVIREERVVSLQVISDLQLQALGNACRHNPCTTPPTNTHLLLYQLFAQLHQMFVLYICAAPACNTRTLPDFAIKLTLL